LTACLESTRFWVQSQHSRKKTGKRCCDYQPAQCWRMRPENWHYPILRLTIYTNKKCGVIESRNRFTNTANWFCLTVRCGLLSWNSGPHI
jgi:hypothetical protein